LDIEDIVVDKEQRRAGIGSSLLKKVFEEAQTDGVKRVMLEVRESNLPAINLYRKFGFKDLSTRKKYYQDGENALVMEKEF
jgi:ribosomal-protein-alanine N-acetyltransferase